MSPGAQPDRLAWLIGHTRLVLLDFDGPVCGIFSGVGAGTVARRLRQVLTAAGIDLPFDVSAGDDPLEVFRFAGGVSRELAALVHQDLTSDEVNAVASAKPTPYAREALVAVRQTGRRTGIVSNNSAEAVELFLEQHQLRPFVDHVVGRESDPALMKPSSYLLNRALGLADAHPESSALIGDSTTDIEAARRTAVRAIGFANNPGKRKQLEEAGAEIVLSDMRELVAALSPVPQQRSNRNSAT